jgi:hypothetical protein
MCHPFMVSRILELAIAATDLAIRAEMISLTEDQGQNEFARV